MAFSYVLQGLTLGLSAASAPGPLQTYIVTQSLKYGWRRSWGIAFAPLLSDIVIVPTIVFFLKYLSPAFTSGIKLVGAIFLIYLAVDISKELKLLGNNAINKVEQTDPTGFLKAVLLNFLSPGPYLFWSLVTGPILIKALEKSTFTGIVFVVSFYIAFIILLELIIFVFDFARKFGDRLISTLYSISLILLLGYSISLFWDFIQFFL